ncbi:MAG: alpha-glucosidase [Clostridia bacterium]|nr:alpha-glucosidase [Clostridia bacterium]
MTDSWWKQRVFYQIYPKSFADSNGDGIGDIRGIIEHIDHLEKLGIGAVWLCPVYDSPLDDEGYDIRDYEKVLPAFGTMEDLQELIDELHKRDIKLVMDMVLNHSSDEHQWFLESRSSKDSPYRDFYIWRDGKGGKEPNNWASFFTPSAWKYDEGTDQWYLHLFSEKQPDLNWEQPALREKIYSMLNRWLDKGIDGFRLDVINLIAKKEGLPDGDSDGYTLAHEHFAFQPKLHEYLKEMRKRCIDGRDAMLLGETPFVTPETGLSVTGDGSELDLIFQFEILDIDSKGEKWDLAPFDLLKFKKIISKWQEALPWNTLFWSNHDQPRPVSRYLKADTYDDQKRGAKMLALAMHLMRGTPFIYQGEEIGMTNYPFRSEDELRDIESRVFLHESEKKGKAEYAWKGIRAKGRDNARTPMQWDDTEYGGFSLTRPWIDVNPNHTYVNVRTEERDPDSVLCFYRKLIAYRNSSDAVRYGDQKLLYTEDPGIFAYERTLKNSKVTVYCNFSKDRRNISAGGKVIFSSPDSSVDTLEPYGYLVTESSDQQTL